MRTVASAGAGADGRGGRAPFGLSLRIGPLLALACVAPLAFSPFSQRALIRAAYDLHFPTRSNE